MGTISMSKAVRLVGEITMFYGDIGVFPTKFHALCNGLHGTPDLRGQFVRAWSDEEGQEYAGSPARRNNAQSQETSAHSHTITVSQYSGSKTTNSAGNHSHNVQGYVRNSYDANDPFSNYQGLDTGAGGYGTSNSGGHAHTVDIAHEHTATAANSGGVETRPKNYALAYIMRIN